MEGYFDDENKNKGCLRIYATNIDEFNYLIKKAKKEAHQLNETINELTRFQLDVCVESNFKTETKNIKEAKK